MLNLQALYFDPVPAKIALAKDLYNLYGQELTAEPSVINLLATLTDRGATLARQFDHMGLGELCGHCGSAPGGGCCSAYMANETDAILLLINLLADRSVEPVRTDDYECCFLGSMGCILQPKPIFCLNYNCQKILEMASDQVKTLTFTAGAVLRAQTELEQYLLERMRKVQAIPLNQSS